MKLNELLFLVGFFITIILFFILGTVWNLLQEKKVYCSEWGFNDRNGQYDFTMQEISNLKKQNAFLEEKIAILTIEKQKIGKDYNRLLSEERWFLKLQKFSTENNKTVWCGFQ